VDYDEYESVYKKWYALAMNDDSSSIFDRFTTNSDYFYSIQDYVFDSCSVPFEHHKKYFEAVWTCIRHVFLVTPCFQWHDKFSKPEYDPYRSSNLYKRLSDQIAFFENIDEECSKFERILGGFLAQYVNLLHNYTADRNDSFIYLEGAFRHIVPFNEFQPLCDKLFKFIDRPYSDGFSPFRSPSLGMLYKLKDECYSIFDPAVTSTRTDLGASIPYWIKSSIQIDKDKADELGIPFELPVRKNNTWSPSEVYDSLFNAVGLGVLFAFPASIGVSQLARDSHTWIVAPPNTGKSSLLTKFIIEDLAHVAGGDRSVIVMESNRDLISSIERFKLFAEGEALADKLIIIDPSDIEHPISMNLFDLGYGNLANLSELDRYAMENVTKEMLNYVFHSLLGIELTRKQQTLFDRVIYLMLSIQDANIDVMVDILDNGVTKYTKVLDSLDDDTKTFFLRKFPSSTFVRTREEILTRIEAFKSNKLLYRMFGANETKISFFEELQSGKCILINTPVDVLGFDGVELYGRFMMALIFVATQRRLVLDKTDRMSTSFIMDEAHDYIASETKQLPRIFAQSRKLNLGLIIAHQNLAQVPNIKAHLMSCAIKLVGKVSKSDARELAPNMNANIDDILNLSPHSYLLSANQQVPFKTCVYSPEYITTKDHLMSEVQYQSLLANNRVRFSRDYEQELSKVAELKSSFYLDPLNDDDDLV